MIEQCSPPGRHLTVSPGKVPWPSAPGRKTPFLTGQPKWFFKIASLARALILKSIQWFLVLRTKLQYLIIDFTFLFGLI